MRSHIKFVSKKTIIKYIYIPTYTIKFVFFFASKIIRICILILIVTNMKYISRGKAKIIRHFYFYSKQIDYMSVQNAWKI